MTNLGRKNDNYMRRQTWKEKSEKYWGQRQNGWAGAIMVGRGGNNGQGQVMVGRGR